MKQYIKSGAAALLSVLMISGCSKTADETFQPVGQYIVVTDYGIKNDGTEIGSELNLLVKDAYGSTLYFPAGTYNLTEPIRTPYDYKKNVNIVFDKNAHITTSKPLDALLMVGFTEISSSVDVGLREFSYIEGGHFDATNAKRGIWVNGCKQLVSLRDMSIYYCSGRHIEISRYGDLPVTSTSCDTKIENISIQGKSSNDNNFGIYIDAGCADCKIADTFIYGTKCALYTNTAGHIINNLHILSWRVGDGIEGDFSGTIGIEIAKQGFFEFNEVYFDTVERDFVIDGDIDVEMIVSKCITHSYKTAFGKSFLSHNGNGKLQAKISSCIFNLDSKQKPFKIFDVNSRDILNDSDNAITFSDNILRSPANLWPYDLSLMMKFDRTSSEKVFDKAREIGSEGVVIGLLAASQSSNELKILHGDGSFTELSIDAQSNVQKNVSTSATIQVTVVKRNGFNILVLSSYPASTLFPEVIDLQGNSSFLSTPSKDRLWTLADYE